MQRPLTIAVPIHSFEPGGVERVGLNLARAWQDMGHDVRVVLGRKEGADRFQAPRLNYDCRAAPFSTACFETLWMIACLLAFLRRHRVDAIFCAGNTYAIVCVAMRLRLGSDCPPIIAKVSNDLDRHDLPRPARWAYRAWTAFQGLLIDRFVGMAPPMRAEIASLMRVPASRIAIVPDPALTRDRAARLLGIERSCNRDAAVRFLVVGRLAPQKNYALLLRAFANGRRVGDTLTIVGDGPERSSLERLTARLELEAHVCFSGHLASPDAEYGRADCLLLSSDYEGVPAVVIEAIAAGLAIVATDCSRSMGELLAHGARGTLVATRDARALSSAIAQALSLPFLSPVARRYADAFIVDAAAGEYLDVMRSALRPTASLGEEIAREDVRQVGVRGV
jgi:glycosyltransferase involved in cell wall biosynthesis